jgi:hypothetical protein
MTDSLVVQLPFLHAVRTGELVFLAAFRKGKGKPQAGNPDVFGKGGVTERAMGIEPHAEHS